MGIENPETYGDYYWANEVEARNAADEQIESAFAPLWSALLQDIPDIEGVPPALTAFYKTLGQPPSAGFGGFALGVGVEMIDETLHSLLGPMMKIMQRSINRSSRETWLTSQEANTLFRQGKIQEDLWELVTASEGYEDINGRFLYQSQEPYPSLPELILYARYHDDPDNPFSEVQEWFDVNARDWPVWKWLGLQRKTTQDVQRLYKRGKFEQTDFYTELAQIGWSQADRPLVEELGWLLPNPMLIVQGGLMTGRQDDDLLSDISLAEIHPEYAKRYLDAVLTKPATQDIVSYQLRRDPSLAGLSPELRKIGIHPEYAQLYKELAYMIPPVGDIITMAVREAFTPAIAERFGQYEDFPEPFAEWAGKKGLTEDWAKRYWASHWSLPSAQQGFEMLHRGAVNEEELNLLLRALDIMPFWREKLTAIAYRRLTRVDVRRMFKLGVLNEEEVYQSYLELGYNDRDAKRMTEFTVQWALPKEAKVTQANVLSAYKSRMIDRSTASRMLEEMEVTEPVRNFMLDSVDYKKDIELREAKIRGIRNLYKKRVYDENQARDQLSKLALPAEEINSLMEQWYFDVTAEPTKNWTTAQTIGFIQAGTITKERGINELRLMGYDDEHINAYLAEQ
jgi:hypothetical protein